MATHSIQVLSPHLWRAKGPGWYSLIRLTTFRSTGTSVARERPNIENLQWLPGEMTREEFTEFLPACL